MSDSPLDNLLAITAGMGLIAPGPILAARDELAALRQKLAEADDRAEERYGAGYEHGSNDVMESV